MTQRTTADARAEKMNDFLAQTDWRDAQRDPLAGDASNRKYERLRKAGGTTAVLMDADPAKGEDVRPFIKIAQHLLQAGLSAPQIYQQDTQNGFLILEDLGDALFARVLAKQPAREWELYRYAADVLLHLKSLPPCGVAAYDAGAMSDAAHLVLDWYVPAATGSACPAGLSAEFRTRMCDALEVLGSSEPVLSLRDYHAENLLWLPERAAVGRVGLLDFQDAMMAHPAYDLMSMLKDIRRDVSEEMQGRLLDDYIARAQECPEDFAAAYAGCSAQRQLRIIGVFARLSVRDGRTGYLDFLGHTWRHLQTALAHPHLHELAAFLRQYIPAPEGDVIAKLKASHG